MTYIYPDAHVGTCRRFSALENQRQDLVRYHHTQSVAHPSSSQKAIGRTPLQSQMLANAIQNVDPQITLAQESYIIFIVEGGGGTSDRLQTYCVVREESSRGLGWQSCDQGRQEENNNGLVHPHRQRVDFSSRKQRNQITAARSAQTSRQQTLQQQTRPFRPRSTRTATRRPPLVDCFHRPLLSHQRLPIPRP